MKLPPDPPPPPSVPPDSGGRGHKAQQDKGRPSVPPGDDVEVYDLGSTSGDEADEVERERALRELMDLEAAAGPPAGDDVPVVEISVDGEADDSERDQALRELIDLETGPTVPSDEEPVIDLSADADLDSLDPERAVREVVELGGPERPRHDEEPVIDISVGPDVDDVERARAIRDVVKLGADRPIRRASARSQELPAGEASDPMLRAQAILEVVQHAAKVTREYAAAKEMRTWRARPIVLAALAASCLLIALYSQVARPEWVYGPDPSRVPVAQRHAQMRFAMALVALRVFAYRDEMRGFLPQSLNDVRVDWATIGYRAVSNSEFELRTTDGSAPPLLFRSREDARRLLSAERAAMRAHVP